MNIKLLTKHHVEFLSLKGGYTGSYESTLVKMPHCWKSHVTAHVFNSDGYSIDAHFKNKSRKYKMKVKLKDTFSIIIYVYTRKNEMTKIMYNKYLTAQYIMQINICRLKIPLFAYKSGAFSVQNKPK